MQPALMDRKILWLLILTTVLTTGNIYFAQPLLGLIAADFGRSAGTTGFLMTLSQAGYVVGLLFLTPLGDVLEKRRLLILLLIFASISLAAYGLAPHFIFVAVAAFAVGMSSVVTQILIPFVAVLSAPQESARNLGALLSGALIGVLISRTFSGFLAAHFGWRGVYLIAAVVMLLLCALLRVVLPEHHSEVRIPYGQLLHSLRLLLREVKGLRSIAISGALCYAGLQAFWAALTFHLEGPIFHQNSDVVGAFGLVGAIGALGAQFSGRYAARIGNRRLTQICIAMMIVSYLIFAVAGGTWAGLIIGVIILDLFAQAATVSNQTQLYTLHAGARTRLNTIYKGFYFCGGAAGSALASQAWEYTGWIGACAIGILFLVAAFFWERKTVGEYV